MTGDAELYAAAMAGGPEAFGPIIERYQDAVFGVALARLRDFHEAEDAAQEVFVEAFERLGALKDPSRLGAWLRSVTIHRSIDRLRRRRETTAGEETQERATTDPAPPAEMERRELRDRVLAAIGRLSKTQRETTTLFYINGYSIEEVAGIQDVPAGTVKRRLHDARERLKQEMLRVVEEVLKSEAPKEDLGQRVFEVLSRRGTHHEHEIVVALRRLGAAGGIDGFVRAFESPSPVARRHAISFAAWFDAPENRETITDLLKRGLQDPNQAVRSGAMRAALERFACSDERKRTEFVPLIVGCLFDRAKQVRQCAACVLRRGWASDVPLERAARALLEETNRTVRQSKEDLLRAVLDARAPEVERTTIEPDMEARLDRLKRSLKSPNNAVRRDALCHILELPMSNRRKAAEVVPLVVGMLNDRARRVRWRAAYELGAWAADVPLDPVEKALRAETHDGTRRQMQHLLRKATEEQVKNGN